MKLKLKVHELIELLGEFETKLSECIKTGVLPESHMTDSASFYIPTLLVLLKKTEQLCIDDVSATIVCERWRDKGVEHYGDSLMATLKSLLLEQGGGAEGESHFIQRLEHHAKPGRDNIGDIMESLGARIHWVISVTPFQHLPLSNDVDNLDDPTTAPSLGEYMKSISLSEDKWNSLDADGADDVVRRYVTEKIRPITAWLVEHSEYPKNFKVVHDVSLKLQDALKRVRGRPGFNTSARKTLLFETQMVFNHLAKRFEIEEDIVVKPNRPLVRDGCIMIYSKKGRGLHKNLICETGLQDLR